MLNGRWAGRVDARHGMAALCLALGGGLLTALGLATGGCAGAGAGQMLRVGYAAALATQDLNGDGALDRGEVAAMVERTFPPERRAGQSWVALRAWLIAGYMAQDRNGDGLLTLDELLKAGPEALPLYDGPEMAPAQREG